MNRLNTFLSISALSLASSVSVAVADSKGFDSKKLDSVSSSLVDSQELNRNQADTNADEKIIKK